jgi:hypothetical protein
VGGVHPSALRRVAGEGGWDDDPPEGGVFHACWFEDGGIHVVDVWESEQDFRRFFEERLRPVLKDDMKVRGEPKYRFRKLHATFNDEARRAKAGS